MVGDGRSEQAAPSEVLLVITTIPGVGTIDDSIPAGQPGGPPAIVQPGSNVPTSTIPDASTVVPFNQDVSGLGPDVSPSTPTP